MNKKFVLITFIIVAIAIAIMLIFPANPVDESVRLEEYCTQFQADSCPTDKCHSCVLPPWNSMFTCHSIEYCTKSIDIEWLKEHFPWPEPGDDRDVIIEEINNH